MSETNFVVAPGEYLAEWMEDNHVYSHMFVSSKLDWSYGDLALFLVGNLRIIEEDAENLFKLTKIPSRTWMNYEMQYNKDLVRLWEND